MDRNSWIPGESRLFKVVVSALAVFGVLFIIMLFRGLWSNFLRYAIDWPW